MQASGKGGDKARFRYSEPEFASSTAPLSRLPMNNQDPLRRSRFRHPDETEGDYSAILTPDDNVERLRWRQIVNP